MADEQPKQKDQAILQRVQALLAEGRDGQRLPRVRDLMAEFGTSQRVVQRVLAPFLSSGHIVARPGAGLTIRRQTETETTYTADCLLLYRSSESRLARTLLMELVARLKRRGHRVVQRVFAAEDEDIDLLAPTTRYRCCLLQANFEVIPVAFLARIRAVSDALVIDGVSVTGIDADVIGTNWREALSIGYRHLQAQGHARISFLTSSHDARQIAMARREFLLLSGWEGTVPSPLLFQRDRLPGSYRRQDLVEALLEAGRAGATAMIVWGLVDGYLLDAALHETRPMLDRQVSLLLLGSVDMPSEHVRRFDIVGNSDAEKLDLFERVLIARIERDPAPARTHYLPIYLFENGSAQRLDATS
ncbi:GntR family transcriptional regulator [Tropicimonas sp. IMCC6043]|uniref:GntR family transcriptional regulator n=1 Tax=Tropicimonas sp. IMCC6043 TaxID=2510645 RepID=UPI0013EAD9ED|nr:GntR family transcriptional regulator [Tropicimonas sp. IMCC6043]